MRRKRKSKPGLRLDSDRQRLWETFVFLMKVIVLSIPLYIVIAFSVSLAPLQHLDVAVSSAVLRAMGYTVQQDGAFVTVGSQKPFSFYLTEDCTAWKSMLFLFALIFAVPAVSLKKRLLGLGFGIPVLWLGNQARILGVVLTERATSVQFAMFTHDYFWRVFLVFLVLGIWAVWMNPASISQRVLPRRMWMRPSFRFRSSSRLISRKTKR